MKIPKMFIHFGRRRRPSASPLAAQGNAVRFSSVKNKSAVASSGATFRKNREKDKWGSFVHRNQKKSQNSTKMLVSPEYSTTAWPKNTN